MAASKSTLEVAVERAGGIRALGRTLGWDPSAIVRILGGEKISAYRAGQVADYLELGRSERDKAILEALRAMSKTDAETVYWATLQDEGKLIARAKTLALQAWFTAGDRDPKLYELLEGETLKALQQELQDRRIRRKSA